MGTTAFTLNSESTTGRKKKILIGSAVALVVVAAIVIPIAIVYSQPPESNDTNGDRIACFPLESDLAQSTCEERGCSWDERGQVQCYLETGEYGYEVAEEPTEKDNGMEVKLRLKKDSLSLYGDGLAEVVFKVDYYDEHMFRFAFYQSGESIEKNQPPVPLNIPNPTSPENPEYEVKLIDTTVGSLFNFQVIRKSSKAVILDTSIGGLTIAEQFLMITFKLPTRYLYGIGENTHSSFLHDMNYKMWPIFARDQPPGDGELNLYGSHPFYTVSEDDGSSHGVFFFNSHSIDVTTLPAPGLTYRTIGGGLDFFVFMGPKPEEVIQQYTSLIGRTMIPPYYALGFQISRYGYKSTQDIKDVVERTREAGIPQDIQYADIDYMDEQADFTFGDNFKNMSEYFTQEAGNGLRFIPILDPAINTERPNYDPHTRARKSKVYITWYNDTLQPPKNCEENSTHCQDLDNVILGYVWPTGKTAFPDFFKQKTQKWWTNEIQEFAKLTPFDGIWIDMNEPANFDTNLDKPFNWPPGKTPWNLHCPENQWDDPPYKTLAASRSNTKRLSDKTICMVGRQGENGEFLHYAVHNLYGWSETQATYNAVREVTGKRSVIISRSTFASSGKWAGHWLGDNTARWKDMHTSIIGMMEFNMFGIPYIGADICGFFENTTEQLCQRWMELGAFYPFSRNHNSLGFADQDPAIWPSVTNSSRKALNIRYQLLPYLYTLFYQSHMTGSTVIRPLYHEFPTDMEAKTIDKQFLWGPALMISPVLELDVTQLRAYVPNATWYDYYTGERVAKIGYVTLETPLDKINLHIRGGHILPIQEEALNTQESRKNVFGLMVALDANGAANGELFWDDGESQDTVENKKYDLLEFSFSKDTFELTVKLNESKELDSLKLDTLHIYGQMKEPTTIMVNDKKLSKENYKYNNISMTAVLFDLDLPMTAKAKITLSFDEA